MSASASPIADLPRAGVTLRFWVEPLMPHTQREPGREPTTGYGRKDLVELLTPRNRWAFVFPDAGEIKGFRTIREFKDYCYGRFETTKWSRGWTGDWTPENGEAWISDKGVLWDLERGPVTR